MKIKWYVILLPLLILLNPLQAALVVNAGDTYTENFNSMGTGTMLPDNWLITFDEDFTYPINALNNTSSSVMYSASGGTPTTPGTYKFRQSGTTDYAVGAIPNMLAYESSLVILHLSITDPNINALEITFDLETYYIGDNLESMILGLWSSSQVTTDWNAVTSAWDPSHAAGHYFGAPPSKSASATLSSNDFEVGDLYLIFQFNGQARSGVALDNVSITAVPEPQSLNLLGVMSLLLVFTRKRK